MHKIKSLLSKLFNDNNNINEQSLIGFVSFVIMIIYSVVDITTGLFGKDLEIKEYIYDSFKVVTLGTFGIGSIKSIFKNKVENED